MTWYLPALRAAVADALGPSFTVTDDVPATKPAWLAIPCFADAKQRGVTPAEAAAAVADRLRQAFPDLTVETEGGFVNLRPGPNALAAVLTEAQQRAYGANDLHRGKTVVVEFSAPNIAKPMGVGHLRSTVIGDALQRLYATQGYAVHAVNHLGDWGTGFGNLMAAYQRQYGDLVPRPEITITDLLALYVGFNAQLEQDDSLRTLGRDLFARLEQGDPAVVALWQAFVSLSLDEFRGMYGRLHITFDDPDAGESRYQPLVAPLVERALADGTARESDGAVIIPIPHEPAPLLLRKADGSTIYGARDLAAIEYRQAQYHPDAIVYVVANEQALHFRQVFAAARALKLVPDTTELLHVKFGLVRTAEGKMSTRKGTLVVLNDLLDQAVAKAGELLGDRLADLPATERAATAERLGIGAVKFLDLSHDRQHDIVFDWDRALSLTGDSAPYLMYAHVRASNILMKLGAADSTVAGNEAYLPHATLIRHLARYPLVLTQATAEQAPHVVAQYLSQLAAQFNGFYEQYPVASAAGDEQAARAHVVAAVRSVLAHGLAILGIETVGSM